MGPSDKAIEAAHDAVGEILTPARWVTPVARAAAEAAYPVIRADVVNEMIAWEYVVKTDLEARIRADVIAEVVEALRHQGHRPVDFLTGERIEGPYDAADFVARTFGGADA